MPEAPRPRWHPLLDLLEPEPGHWTLLEQYGKQYGDIRLVRRQGVLGYRALIIPPRGTTPIEVVFATSLREAVERAHREWVGSHALDADRMPANF